jgi:RNA polymerase sigma-70 factor (ECF subfamily)
LRTPSDAIYDTLLVLRWRQNGDRAAMDELLRRWERRVLYYIRRLVHDEQDAWDVLQQTWLQVVRKLASLREPGRFPAWLYAIARNAALAHHRSAAAIDRHIDAEAEVAELTEHADDVTDFGTEDVESIHRALGQLSPAHREVLTLLFLKDLSVDDIAELIGVSGGTVKSRAFYARQKLREILGGGEASHG